MTNEERRAEDTKIRSAFPLLTQYPELIYLDNAATTQKPDCVLKAQTEFYEKMNANPFRGLYDLANTATEEYENARKSAAQLIGADGDEIIFTRNATESLNLLAASLCDLVIEPGDEILVGITEHHSNMLPWRAAVQKKDAKLVYLDCDKNGVISVDALKKVITDRTKILAVTQLSNVLGSENDVKSFAKVCHDQGCLIVVDGSQSVPHIPVNVKELDADFLVFSGHKMMAPMGIGVLYGKKELLEKMPPFLQGGEMIDSVTRDSVVYAPVPHKFEAGTVNAGGAYALNAAICYLQSVGYDTIVRRESELTVYTMEQMLKMPGIHVVGSQNPKDHHGIITFTVDGVHPHDVASILDTDHVAVRAGHHCAQPLMQHLGLFSTTRVSFAFYNTKEEADAFLKSLSKVRERMGYHDGQ